MCVVIFEWYKFCFVFIVCKIFILKIIFIRIHFTGRLHVNVKNKMLPKLPSKYWTHKIIIYMRIFAQKHIKLTHTHARAHTHTHTHTHAHTRTHTHTRTYTHTHIHTHAPMHTQTEYTCTLFRRFIFR